MARPRKWRRICRLPVCSRFGPLGGPEGTGPVIMTVDEYETIRLIDLEGMTQEECAVQMNISRTTVQGIYNDARRKLADSLVNGKVLFIEGGDFELCEGDGRGRDGCCRRRGCWKDAAREDDDEKTRSDGK